jgi:hypothetical protein
MPKLALYAGKDFHANELDSIDSIIQWKHKVKEILEEEILSA